MHADRVVDAVCRFVFQPDERLDERFDQPTSVVLHTARDRYEARPADWRIADADFVADAVRVVVARSMPNFTVTYGLLLLSDGDTLFLNDLKQLRELGGRVGDGLDPLAYAEVLAELCSGRLIDEPVVYPFAATEMFRSGWLITDVAAFRDRYPVRQEVPAPTVRRDGAAQVVEFCSHNYYLSDFAGAAIDVYRWTVRATVGRPAEWSRHLLAGEVAVP